MKEIYADEIIIRSNNTWCWERCTACKKWFDCSSDTCYSAKIGEEELLICPECARPSRCYYCGTLVINMKSKKGICQKCARLERKRSQKKRSRQQLYCPVCLAPLFKITTGYPEILQCQLCSNKFSRDYLEWLSARGKKPL